MTISQINGMSRSTSVKLFLESVSEPMFGWKDHSRLGQASIRAAGAVYTERAGHAGSPALGRQPGPFANHRTSILRSMYDLNVSFRTTRPRGTFAP